MNKKSTLMHKVMYKVDVMYKVYSECIKSTVMYKVNVQSSLECIK